MNTRIIIAAAGILGAGVGALITWRVLKSHYEAITQEEIDSVKLHYAKLFKEGEHGDLSSMVAKYKDKVTGLHYVSVSADSSDDAEGTPEDPGEEPDDSDTASDDLDDETDEEPEERVVHNVWRTARDNPHPEDEAYVITFNQFNEEHDDYDKGDLTYYEGDDILVDSQESPIDDVESVIGPDALTRFGDGSNSKDIVYVRNDRLSMDFEISHDSRSFTEYILGVETLGKKKKVHKMRDEE